MIAHFSIPAREPKTVAELFARIIDGVAVPFPPAPGGWIALAKDGSGVGVEVVPEIVTLEPGSAEDEPGAYVAGARAAVSRTPGAIHIAMTTALSADEVIRLGHSQGWRTLHCDRGGFDLIEMWVDNSLLVEILPPDSTARYLAFANPATAKARFETMNA